MAYFFFFFPKALGKICKMMAKLVTFEWLGRKKVVLEG